MKTPPILTIGIILAATSVYAATAAEKPAPTQPKPAEAAKPAQAPAPKKPPPAPSAEALAALRAAREKLTGPGVTSVQARVIERVAIGGRRFHAEGRYLQGTDLKVKLELKIARDPASETLQGSLLQVCDGTILWTRHTIGGEERITRRDVRQILAAAKANAADNLVRVEIGLGGLPALLASLEQSMTFETLSEHEINGKKFTVVAGTWKPEALNKLLTSLSRKSLPDHVPDSVRVFLDPKFQFPRRIAFLKQRPPANEVEALVEFDFLNVSINPELNEREFEFVPPDGVRPVDVTNDYVQLLKPAAK